MVHIVRIVRIVDIMHNRACLSQISDLMRIRMRILTLVAGLKTPGTPPTGCQSGG